MAESKVMDLAEQMTRIRVPDELKHSLVSDLGAVNGKEDLDALIVVAKNAIISWRKTEGMKHLDEVVAKIEPSSIEDRDKIKTMFLDSIDDYEESYIKVAREEVISIIDSMGAKQDDIVIEEEVKDLNYIISEMEVICRDKELDRGSLQYITGVTHLMDIAHMMLERVEHLESTELTIARNKIGRLVSKIYSALLLEKDKTERIIPDVRKSILSLAEKFPEKSKCLIIIAMETQRDLFPTIDAELNKIKNPTEKIALICQMKVINHYVCGEVPYEGDLPDIHKAIVEMVALVEGNKLSDLNRIMDLYVKVGDIAKATKIMPEYKEFLELFISVGSKIHPL